MNPHAQSGARYELAGWFDPAYELVRRMSGLSPGAAIAWQLLWIESRGGRQLVRTTSDAVGQARGRGNDAGREDLKNLAAGGLIRVIERPGATGNRVASGWLLEVFDPVQLHHEQLRRVDPDAQLELGFEQRPQSGGDGSPRPNVSDGPPSPGTRDQRALGCVAADGESDATLRPPAYHQSRAPDETLPAKSRLPPVPEEKMKSSPLPVPEGLRKDSEQGKGSGKGRASDRRIFAGKVSPATPIGDAIGQALSAINDRDPTKHAEQVRIEFEQLRSRVNCPAFDEFSGLALIAAEALVDGRLPIREREACLLYVNRIEKEKRLIDTRSRCFNGAMRRALLRHGIDPTGGRSPREKSGVLPRG